MITNILVNDYLEVVGCSTIFLDFVEKNFKKWKKLRYVA